MSSLNARLRNASLPQPSRSPIGSDPIERVGSEIVATYQLIEEAWKKAEAKLASSHVPTDVRVKVVGGNIGDDDNPFGEFTVYLGYCKIKNQWRICWIRESLIYNCDPRESEEYECKPITECPVDVRLDMFDSFQPLYEEVIKVTRQYVPKIKEAVAKFESSLEFIDL